MTDFRVSPVHSFVPEGRTGNHSIVSPDSFQMHYCKPQRLTAFMCDTVIQKVWMENCHIIKHIFFQDSTSLPVILVLEKPEVSDEVKEEARLSVEHFLQVKHMKSLHVLRNTCESFMTMHCYCVLFSLPGIGF